MAGTWESSNKVLPGAYINIRTNEPLSITPGERGTVVILEELATGASNTIYTATAEGNDYPEGITDNERKLAIEALKNANKVMIYVLPESHTLSDVETALDKLKTIKFNTLCYPYDENEDVAIKSKIKDWIDLMRNDEGVKVQAVMANIKADSEAIISVTQSIVKADGTILSPAEVTAWVAGATAGASVATSNTAKVYAGAVDVSPRKTKTEMEAAVQNGEFIFKVDGAQNVTVVYDINTLTTITQEKGKMFAKNRVIRTLDNIANDLSNIFESNHVGKTDNTADGRSILKAVFIDYFNALQGMNAIENFDIDDVQITPGADKDAVIVDVAVQPVDSVEKIYITVNLT